jgi:hypothetical protein
MRSTAPASTVPTITVIGRDTEPSDSFVDAVAELLLAVVDADRRRQADDRARAADGADGDGEHKEQDV